ncbi:hypothetical protein ABEB36_015326 [Hypothenemus hampei]|uniref:C2H2-type domain-containing protein n=1 Tax=Hypothenemus hampei TaxID=57062 RepID=A0ABD1DZU8_HYPHA
METLKKSVCSKCGLSFSNLCNLRRHVKKIHPENIDVLAPTKYKKPENFLFSCSICKKNFSYKKNFTCHMKTHQKVNDKDIDEIKSQRETENLMQRKSRKCPLCSFTNVLKKKLLQHFKVCHQIEISSQQIEMLSLQEFNEWKKSVESNSNSKFVIENNENYKEKKITSYVCHRSGNYIPEGKHLRHLKIGGSNKINGYCPAGIKKIEYLVNEKEKKIEVLYNETHVGHQNEIESLTLTKEERQILATEIASKIPFDSILDEIYDSVSNNKLKRTHLAMKKDLFNIEQCFNLSHSAVRHSNDAVSVDAFVHQMRTDGDVILFYKPQGEILEYKPQLKKEDFILILMNTAQAHLLTKYGSDCICLDSTHGLNNYDFELSTLLVLDDMREGFPAAYMICNRSDSEVFKLFFLEIKKKVGTITPIIFMSDLANSFYNAWISIMGIPVKRLFCTWHIDRAWRKNLPLIKGKENQVIIYKQLRVLLQERDATKFEIMIKNFTENTNSHFKDFIAYFRKKLYKQQVAMGILLPASCRYQHKYAFRKITSYNAYLKGKKVKRLDKGIDALMKLTRNKLINRLITMKKGKISSKLQNIRQRHKNFEKLDPTLLVPVQDGWEVPSASTFEIYKIQENLKFCDCKLICSECSICIHRYYCSCLDSSIKFNMCKHIHLVAQKFPETQGNSNIDVEKTTQ